VEKATTVDLDQIRYAPEGSGLPPDVLLAPGPRGALWLLGSDGQVTQTLKGHTGSVLAMDWSADGKTLITGGVDQEVRAWDIVRRESRLLGKHVGVVERLVVAPDGKHAASTSGGELIIWDVAAGSGRKIMATRHRTGLGRTHEAAGEYARIAFAPDGGTVAALVSESNTVELWPVAGGAPERLQLPETLTSLRYTPGGGLLLGAGSGKIYQWVRGHQWHILLTAASDTVQDIASARRPDSPMPVIIAGASRDKTIELVRWLEDDRFELHGHAAAVRRVQFSPDGTHLLSGSADGTVRLWYLRPPYDQTLFTDGPSHAAAVSPDGRLIAFGTEGAVELQKIVANAREADERPIHVGTGAVAAVAWAPDGKSVAAAKDGGVYLVGVDGSAHLLAKTRTLIATLTFVDGGRRLVGYDEDGAVWVWEIASGQAWALATAGAAAGPPAVAVDGDAIAVPLHTRTLVFSARDPGRPPLAISDGTEQVAAALSSTGDRLAIGTAKGGVALWDLSSRNRRPLIDEGGGGAVLALGLSRDGRLASLTTTRDLKYVDLASGRVEVAPHDEVTVRGAQLSADLDHGVAWAGPELWVWDRASFTWRSLPGFSDVRGVALSADGRRAIVTGDSDSAERIEIGSSPVPRDAAGLRRWLDAATSTVIQANRPTTPR
jgi:WD40 repeat protein